MRKKGGELLLIAVTALLAITLLAHGNQALAVDVYVPDHYPTIQEALDATTDDYDIVWVRAGTYYENITFPASRIVNLYSTDGPEVTIIDGGNTNSVIRMINTGSTGQYVRGFTITNGNAPQGGGIYISSSSYGFMPTFVNCIITTNKAAMGAGVYSTGSSYPIFDNCVITLNVADNDGGGVFNAGGQVIIENNSTISNNTATNGSGGGIVANGGSTCDVFLEQSTVSGNTASISGGGIALLASSSYGWCQNSIITGNTATLGSGGAIISNGFMTDLYHCTISENSAPNGSGGGIINTGSTTLLVGHNNILWGDSPDEIDAIDLLNVDLTYSDIQNDPTGGLGNIDADPMFVGPNDYHLAAGSPCINSGTIETSVTNDIEGNPRPSGGGYDMGAYEFLICTDGDNDGVTDCDGDCDDSNPDVYPTAPEICDGLDNDCDDIVPADEVDVDNDTYMICEGDCDDNDSAVNPGETEVCTAGLDEDCDGLIDNLDSDCPSTGICGDYTTRQECNGDPNCSWNKNQRICEDDSSGGGTCSDNTDEASCLAADCNWNGKKQTCR